MKSKGDKLDVDKLVTVLVDLCKLSNAVKNGVKKNVYNVKIQNIEDEIPDITNLATKATLNAKINEAKGEIPNITNLASTTALTSVENKIPNASNVCQNDHDHNKYITTPEFNLLIAEHFAARLKQANLASKNGIGHFVKKDRF